jgi:hypothetical protein
VLLLFILLIGLGVLAYLQTPLGSMVKDILGISGTTTGTTTNDKTKPVITGATANVGAGGVVITWKTDELSSSQVEYGKTNTYGTIAPAQPQDDPTGTQSIGVTDHSVTISAATLEKGVTYHFKAMSKDKAGNEGESGDSTFTTLAAE